MDYMSSKIQQGPMSNDQTERITARQAWMTLWFRAGRWCVLVVVAAVLFLVGCLISRTAGESTAYRNGYRAGLKSVTHQTKKKYREQQVERERQKELSLAGLSPEEFENGSGWYIAKFELVSREKARRTSGQPDSTAFAKTIQFAVLQPLSRGKWYYINRHGGLSYRGR